MLKKKYLEVDVVTAARQRIERVFRDFTKVYVSFSAGKDSSVLVHLVADIARSLGRKFALLFVDLEAQYAHTMAHAEHVFDSNADIIEPYWLSLPLVLSNGVSQYQPRWVCWDPKEQHRWVRQPSKWSITDGSIFPWFRPGMEFEELVEDFGSWYAAGTPTACLVGIRSQESLNRFRTLISSRKSTHQGLQWTTEKPGGVFNAYPIYDWRTEDIWRYNGKTKAPYNEVYDLMHQAGLTIHEARLCQPYGFDQRKGLHLFHVLEPQTWAKVVERVAGANSGALYAHATGNMMGRVKITCPPGHTWRSFAEILLAGMPPASRTHFVNKITVFLKWYEKHYGFTVTVYNDDRLPDAPIFDGPTPEVLARFPRKGGPTWFRVVKMILKNDWWGKELSFSQTKSDGYEAYIAMMRRKRLKWSGKNG